MWQGIHITCSGVCVARFFDYSLSLAKIHKHLLTVKVKQFGSFYAHGVCPLVCNVF